MRATNPLIHYNYFCKKLPVPDVEVLKHLRLFSKKHRGVMLTYPHVLLTDTVFFLL